MDKQIIFDDVYKNKRIFVTGGNGFKGSWLIKRLMCFDAIIKNYSLVPETEPNHFVELNTEIESEINDIRDSDSLSKSIKKFKPDIIFHLAAQPLVRESYLDPVTTFETNIMGTVNILEICRNIPSVRAIVVITTDKVYESKEWVYGYRENDRLGGYDPYSASKVCSELVTDCFRKSFYDRDVLISSVRAGNVIGGGDWSTYRLVPNIVKTVFDKHDLRINPTAVRPWQHVLDCIEGYLSLGRKLLGGNSDFEGAWNFGPNDKNLLSVQKILDKFGKYWDVPYKINEDSDKKFKETDILKLDTSKARTSLNWNPIYDINDSIKLIVDWYDSYYKYNELLTEQQINNYIQELGRNNVK